MVGEWFSQKRTSMLAKFLELFFNNRKKIISTYSKSVNQKCILDDNWVTSLYFSVDPEPIPQFKIASGQVAPDNFAPYQCSMLRNSIHFCGCAIISAHFVLTAAHCIVGYESH